jgi:hypothetical protein
MALTSCKSANSGKIAFGTRLGNSTTHSHSILAKPHILLQRLLQVNEAASRKGIRNSQPIWFH